MLVILGGEFRLAKDSPTTPQRVSFRRRMISLAVILVVIVFVGSEIWVTRYGPEITNEVVTAYSILAVLGFIVVYLYRKSKYGSTMAHTK